MGFCMTVAEFNKLCYRDFENGAVTDEILNSLKDREAMMDTYEGYGRSGDKASDRIRRAINILKGVE